MQLGSLPDTIKTFCESSQFSPDMTFLDRLYDKVPIFMYGCERTGFSDEVVTSKADSIGFGFTAHPVFNMWISKDHGPIAMTNPTSPDSSRIYGELFLIRPQDLMTVDMRFTNRVLFNRRIIHIRWYPVTHKSVKEKQWCESDVYMYTGEWEYWMHDSQKRKLKLATKFTPHVGDGTPYYYYTAADDEHNRKDQAERHMICM